MSSRSRGRGHRGSGRGGYGHRGGGNWGGNRGGHRGAGGGGGRMDYYHHHHHHGGRSPHPSQRQHDPEKLLASLGPEAQLALTTAIINSVLKTPDGREGRGNFRDNREPNYRHQRDPRRDGRGGYYREESRERRHFGEDRRYEPRSHHQEGRSHHYDREKPPAGPPRSRYGKYPGQSKRRPSPHGHPGAAYKRQSMDVPDHRAVARRHDQSWKTEQLTVFKRKGDKRASCVTDHGDAYYCQCNDVLWNLYTNL